MAEKKTIVFVFNPKAGIRHNNKIKLLIEKHLDKNIDHEFIESSSVAESNRAVDSAIKKGVHIVAAIGGDGTVNHIGARLLNTSTALAIIPTGSGNGLARHMRIPLNVKRAIELLNKGKVVNIDAGYINDRPFFCAAGTGFDAHVIQHFDSIKTRGFLGYILTFGRLFPGYKPRIYTLNIDGTTITTAALLITFANGSQYGNSAFIAPAADIQDGKIDVCIIRPLRFWHLPGACWHLFTKKIDRSPFWEHYQTSKILIKRALNEPVHFDGEPATMQELLTITCRPASLKVLAP